MATVAHCLYCFEALAANLEGRKSMTLEQVQASWADYVKAVSSDDKLSKRLPALDRLAASSPASGSSSPSTGSTTSLQQPGSGVDTPATSVSSLAASPPAITESPLFVTWNTVTADDEHNLRGCIGTFEALELDEGLSSYALTSAIHDMRFSPIRLRELPSLEVVVSLLTDFEDAADAMDWEIGVHGLRLSFYANGRRYGSTYLPDVAPEQGWTKTETVVSLMRKAGWTGRKDKWEDVDLKVVRYQGKRESLLYPEYKQWRDWVTSSSK